MPRSEKESETALLYKYRSLQNWKFIIDLLMNKRLYASNFVDLNDPMEGRYTYERSVPQRFLREIRDRKDRLRICSLSRDWRNTLMWSYYADGHRGIVAGVEVTPPKAAYVEDVLYDNSFHVESSAVKQGGDSVARRILQQKLWAWEHEQEVRILTPNEFVPVKIKKIYLGQESDEEDRKLIRGLVRLASPETRVQVIPSRSLRADF